MADEQHDGSKRSRAPRLEWQVRAERLRVGIAAALAANGRAITPRIDRAITRLLKAIRRRGARVGWHVQRRSARRFQGRAWDPNERKYRAKSFTTETAAEAWAKHEHSRLDTRLSQAGRAPVETLIADYIKDRTRTCSSGDHVDEVERVLRAALAAGVTDLRHPRVAAVATAFLVGARARHREVKPGERAKLSPRTLNRMLNTLRAFGKWSVKRGHVVANPFVAIDAVNVPQDLKATFTLEELAQLTDPIRASHRYHATFLAMAYFGLREGEAVNMRWSWLNWSEGMLRVTRAAGWRLKRQKERLIPIPAEFRAAVKPLADQAQLEGRRDETLNPWLLNRHRKTRQRRFDEYLADCGVQVGDRTPHSARHTWISLMLASGEPETLVQLYAGHDKIETTSEYARSMVQYRRAVDRWKRGEIRLRPRAAAKVAATAPLPATK